MTRIPMTNGFVLIPEGTYIFRIYDASYDDEFGKLEVKMITAQGLIHVERFSLKNKDNTWSDGACNAFSFFAKTALQDFAVDDVNPEELIDHYIGGTIVHSDPIPNWKDPDKTIRFANLAREKFTADGFDTEPCKRALTIGRDKKAEPAPKEPPVSKGLDLDALLGG